MPFSYDVKGTVLQIRNVSHKFADKQILRDINLTVRDLVRPNRTQGQVVSFVGPSGSGKTTLFNIISGKYVPTTGEVLLGEEERPVERGGYVGVVSQKNTLLEHRTVLGNLMIAGHQAGLRTRDAKDKAMGYLSWLGLEQFTGFYPAQLSGGMRQRVAILQQLMCSERLLLMDEPFSGLDVVNKDKVCELIAQVANSHELNTIIITTHDLRTAAGIADTMWILGRDFDAAGKPVPNGATVKEKYDLIARNLAWRPDISRSPEFEKFVFEVEDRFRRL